MTEPGISIFQGGGTIELKQEGDDIEDIEDEIKRQAEVSKHSLTIPKLSFRPKYECYFH